MSCVFPGLSLTFASHFLLQRLLISVDFPTFDLPIKANSGNFCSGQRAREGEESTKEEAMIMIQNSK
ncbi:MAG: hypothetical protein RL023_731 [Candidatus Parcubacteria bacterium]|jgi:hypothetical protein